MWELHCGQPLSADTQTVYRPDVVVQVNCMASIYFKVPFMSPQISGSQVTLEICKMSFGIEERFIVRTGFMNE